MVDQDRMLRFRSELHGIGDLDRVSGTQMLFAFQRFAAIVLDGEGAGAAVPTATSSDDVPHDEPGAEEAPVVPAPLAEEAPADPAPVAEPAP